MLNFTNSLFPLHQKLTRFCQVCISACYMRMLLSLLNTFLFSWPRWSSTRAHCYVHLLQRREGLLLEEAAAAQFSKMEKHGISCLIFRPWMHRDASSLLNLKSALHVSLIFFVGFSIYFCLHYIMLYSFLTL